MPIYVAPFHRRMKRGGIRDIAVQTTAKDRRALARVFLVCSRKAAKATSTQAASPAAIRDERGGKVSAANGTNNEGHGHVYPRPDGVRARCGGPTICVECSGDYVRQNARERRTIPWDSTPSTNTHELLTIDGEKK